MGHKRVIAALMVISVAGLTACTGVAGEGDSSPSGRVSATGGGAAQVIDAERQAPAEPIEGATVGGAVTVWSEIQSEPFLSMDPSNSYWASTTSILSGLLTRSLTQYVYDPEQHTMVLVPDIATDLGTPNDDFTQWAFTVRDGVRFEDGSEVTADDVAYGIKRSFDRATFPTGPPFSNQFLLAGDTYKGPYMSGTSYPGVAVDGNTLTVKTERPFPDMPYWAANPAIGPIPERGSAPATYGEHPLSTGPYKIAEFSPGESMTLVRNDEWDPKTDPGRHAYPDRYVFDVTVPADRIDSTILGDSPPAQTIVSMDNRSPGGYRAAQQVGRVARGSQPCTSFWLPDYRKITDLRVRKAIGYAYPYREASRVRREVTGERTLLGTSILPPAFVGRENYQALGIRPGTTDPRRAKALLNRAGYGSGEYELTILVDPENPVLAQQQKLIQASLQAAGFKVTLMSTPDHDAYLRVRDDPDAPINVRIVTWCSDWPSGSSWFPTLFQSSGSFNLAHFDEPKVDAQIDRISRLPIAEQPLAWGTLDKTIMTDYYPAIITGYGTVELLHGSRIGGMDIDDVNLMPTWKDIYVIE